MTAVFDDDLVAVPVLAPVPSVPRLTMASAPNTSAARLQQPVTGASDPLVGAAARLLSIPLRHAYAMLWRAGVIEVRA